MQQENSSHIIYATPFQPSLTNLEENANMNFSNVAFGYSYSNPQFEKIVLIDKNEKEIAQWKLVNPFLITDSPIFEEKKEKSSATDLTVEDYKMIDLSLDITEQNSNFDDCEIIFENLQPRIKTKGNKEIMFETCYIHGSNNLQIEARIYDLIMPSSDCLELFIPPPINYLERYLELLGMQSNLVANSPLLQNSSTELKDKKIITMKTKADGNCGYRAISILLTGVEDYYWDIRIKIYEYIISEVENIWGIKSHEKINEFKQKLEKISKMSQKAVSEKFWCANEDL
uniref:OTU domain-containing protein n=1 Tax=Panagrolaimus davidi TaxID=227884 RepID=A0A914QFG7_9BILA